VGLVKPVRDALRLDGMSSWLKIMIGVTGTGESILIECSARKASTSAWDGAATGVEVSVAIEVDSKSNDGRFRLTLESLELSSSCFRFFFWESCTTVYHKHSVV
jgi:hypothetical protein